MERLMGTRMRRQAILRVSGEWFVDFFKSRNEVCFLLTHNLMPPDARFCYAYVDLKSSPMICLVIESESFPQTSEDAILPYLEEPVGMRTDKGSSEYSTLRRCNKCGDICQYQAGYMAVNALPFRCLRCNKTYYREDTEEV